MKTIYLVSADHVSPRFTFVNEAVEVSPSPGLPGRWYAWGKLGCSKDYTSPERAAAAMFHDNACTNVRVKVQS